MKVASLTTLILTLALAAIGSSIPHTERQLTCGNPIVRKEWRFLPLLQQDEYIKAIKCMQNRPAITTSTVTGAVSSFDDFQGVHITAADSVHYVGHFLPWHRYYLWIYEKALRDCGYTGGQPYWDWTLDYPRWEKSPLFDPTTGFGGNGQRINDCTSADCSSGGGCISDGPFKDQVVHLGPFNSITRKDYCLKRDFSSGPPANYFAPVPMAATMSQKYFETFRSFLEGESGMYAGQHGAGHAGVGGQMMDFYAAPADPLFYLHHANIDRIWWQWEKLDLAARLLDISGRSRPEKIPPPPDVTLDFVLKMGILAPDVNIREVMNIQGGVLCYDYQ